MPRLGQTLLQSPAQYRLRLRLLQRLYQQDDGSCFEFPDEPSSNCAYLNCVPISDFTGCWRYLAGAVCRLSRTVKAFWASASLGCKSRAVLNSFSASLILPVRP